MFGKVTKKDVNSDDIQKKLESDRVKLYHDIEQDYGFMMEDNPGLIILLENAE